MKRYLTIFLASAMALMVGCTKNEVVEGIAVPEGEMAVNLTISGPFADVATRSYVSGTENAISRVDMLCFDGEGKFITDKLAAVSPSASDPATKGVLTGTVPSNTCRIHFVANFQNLNSSGFVMGSLERSMMKSEALSSGIADEVRFWGYHTETTPGAMKTWLSGGNTVKLLRDRAKVILKNSDPNITSLTWTIGNGVNRGFVAATCVSGENPYTNDYVTATRLTEYSTSGRYATMTDASAIWETPWVSDNEAHPQYLFENANTQSNPIKVVIKATYSDNVVRYHTVLLQSDDNVPYPVVRNQTFVLTVKHLPETAGSDNLTDALSTTDYSNNPYAQVDKEVDEVNNDQFTLKVEKVFYLFDQNGNGVVNFTYTGHDGGDISALDESNFDVSWESKDESDESGDVVPDVSVSPTVNYTNSTGAGTITFPLATLNTELKHNTLQIIAKNSGLSRFVDVYSITEFSFKTDPTLVDNNTTRTVGGESREVYKLTFALPDDFPASQYPLSVKMYTSTLSPFSNSTANAASGSFNVVVASTTGLQESAQTSSWNYGAKSWGSYYEYVIEEASSDNTYTIYLNDVVANFTRNISTVGLYLQIDGFGDPIPLSRVYGFLRVNPVSQTVAFNTTTASFQINAPTNTAWTVSAPSGVTVNPTSGSGAREVTLTIGTNTTTSPRTITATVSSEGLDSKTVTIIQAPGASFSPSDFSFSGNNGSASKSGVSVALTNSSYVEGGWYTPEHLIIGRREWISGLFNPVYNYYIGEITVTPPSGKTITKIIITYRNDYTNNGTEAATSNPAGYSISNNVGTWNGTVVAGNPVSISMGRSNGDNFPQITGIEVLYE